MNEWASVGLLLMTFFRVVVFNVRKHHACMPPASQFDPSNTPPNHNFPSPKWASLIWFENCGVE